MTKRSFICDVTSMKLVKLGTALQSFYAVLSSGFNPLSVAFPAFEFENFFFQPIFDVNCLLIWW